MSSTAPEPTRIRVVALAARAMRISGAEEAVLAASWCSAYQMRW
ncbi:hypothetical protein PV383_47725 [Streptomyces caniscabiei]|uniref:Uncharacterized protein n=1 Tax=Streptomyces caniscabiei TaxID=2746961 RepID=A0ABU4N6U4_9ACTN|nr:MULTISPECIES: hypothetical protein [Streptomyces]MDX2948430.1 hypothetical protein [Streptomyces caniscabiei]MDX2957721.1 hypothetical protein [Streptomyces caniscabiei]MDX2983006.1 hypothetical protein [Streptomyces caniscabiei]MDX3015776.1 hypothetical protein [Streptomyces caniscabiei]MDX3044789.1 hypothetical protein [Streptomyces caniscabiei]